MSRGGNLGYLLVYFLCYLFRRRKDSF
ncbi:GlyGly-CTERM sorting domain-containing protein [Streptococcus ruminantium]